MVQQTACRCTFPSRATGQTKRPRSRSLANRHNPQDFHHFATATPEDEDMPGERGIFQRVLHLRGQTGEATAHIGDASDDQDSGAGWQCYHRAPPFISRISARNSSGVRGSNSFTTPDLRCSSHRGAFPGSPAGHSSGLLRQKGFVTGLIGSGLSVSSTGTGRHSCMS